jgi:hypothetical protein
MRAMLKWVGAAALGGILLFPHAARGDSTFTDANWTSIPPNQAPDGAVEATAVDSAGNLYIGGDFTKVGNMTANYIAKWDGKSWSPLGSGMSGSVFALAVSGTDLYAGGTFTNAGGNPANYVAKWDGNNWTSLGTGVNPIGVLALAVSGNDLYVGDFFITAGGSPANHIAKWNGSSWSALGSGVDNPRVVAMTVVGNDLYDR